MRKFTYLAFILAFVLSACATLPQADAPSTKSAPTKDVVIAPPKTQDPNEPVSTDKGEQTMEGGQGVISPLEPLPNEAEMVTGNAFIDQSSIAVMESYPVQIMLNLEGNLPTPCHRLRAKMSEADDKGRIDIEVYSLVEPDKVCVQMIQPFQENINLGTFPSGKYSLYVNGELVGDFES